MSNFWDLNDGSAVEKTGSFESGGGDLPPIPNGTGCIAAIEEAKWDEFESDKFIALKWRVSAPAAYANRVIFHKIKVFGTSKDKDPKTTADKAKRMLAAIDTNAGGKLMALGREPTDQDLMICLMGRMMAIKVMVWEMEINGEKKAGNWISAVAPSKGAQSAQPAAAPAQAAPAQHAPTAFLADDVPF